VELPELLKSKEYADARRRIDSWRQRLALAGKPEVVAIRSEKDAFFSRMRSARPDLYAVFQVEDKALSESIFKKTTGNGVVID
jgi:hypothetical protein